VPAPRSTQVLGRWDLGGRRQDRHRRRQGPPTSIPTRTTPGQTFSLSRDAAPAHSPQNNAADLDRWPPTASKGAEKDSKGSRPDWISVSMQVGRVFRGGFAGADGPVTVT
jgi:hypothetical protein